MITYILDIVKPASLGASCPWEHQDSVKESSMAGECHISWAHQPVLASICQGRFSSVVVTKKGYLLFILNGPWNSDGESGPHYLLSATVIDACLHTYFQNSQGRKRKMGWGRGKEWDSNFDNLESAHVTSTHLLSAKPRGTVAQTTQGWGEWKSPHVRKADRPMAIRLPSPSSCGVSGGWYVCILCLFYHASRKLPPGQHRGPYSEKCVGSHLVVSDMPGALHRNQSTKQMVVVRITPGNRRALQIDNEKKPWRQRHKWDLKTTQLKRSEQKRRTKYFS